MRLSRMTLATAFSALVLVAASSAMAGPSCPGGGASGTITLTEKKIWTTQASVGKVLKAEQRCTLSKGEEDAGWKLNVVAHLSRQPGADQVNLVLYDQATKPGPDREPVQAYPINTKKDAKIMMAEVEIKPEEGFKAGTKYNVFITRLINGKEEIYARTTLELK